MNRSRSRSARTLATHRPPARGLRLALVAVAVDVLWHGLTAAHAPSRHRDPEATRHRALGRRLLALDVVQAPTAVLRHLCAAVRGPTRVHHLESLQRLEVDGIGLMTPEALLSEVPVPISREETDALYLDLSRPLDGVIPTLREIEAIQDLHLALFHLPLAGRLHQVDDDSQIPCPLPHVDVETGAFQLHVHRLLEVQ